MINRPRDSLELLHIFGLTFQSTVTHVVRNGYFGAPDKFDLTIHLFRDVSRDVRDEVTLARMHRVLSALNLHDDDALW